MRKIPVAIAFVAAAALGTAALAQGPGPGHECGHGAGNGAGMMMGGHGGGMMGGHGGGKMGGHGGGMMGGHGPGGPLALDLTVEQREKVLALQEEERRKNWEASGKMRTEMFKLRGLAWSESADANAYVEQQRKVDELRRDMMKARFESRKQVEAVLTAEQKKQLRGHGPWWLQDSE